MANSAKSTVRIRALKHKQRVFKSNLTNFTNELTEYQDSATARTKLRERIDRLRKQFNGFNDAQDEIGHHEDFDQTETERKDVTTVYDDALANAIQLLEGFEPTISQSTRTVTDSPAPSTSTSISGVHLPKMNLPIFDGRLEKWLPFKDAFLSLIQKHTGLTDIQRFNYLRLSVSGQAQAAIESFTMSEVNYQAAWAQLMETYDNQRALVLRHTALLLETPPMPNSTPDAINNLVNHLQSHIRSLQTLGRSWEDIANDFIISIAIDRMDSETRRTWEQTFLDTQMPQATAMFKHLRNASHQGSSRASAVNQVRTALPETHRPSTSTRSRPSKRSWASATRSKEISSSPVPRKRTFVTTTSEQACKFCNSRTHKSYACPKFMNMTIDDRWAAVRTARLCQNCLQSNHKFENCVRGQCRTVPDNQIDRADLRIPANLPLADPDFHHPGKIDMLLGTGPALSCLSIGQINLSKQTNVDLILQKTQFGWILGGDFVTTPRMNHRTLSTNVNFELQRFWEIEEGAVKQFRSLEDQACESHFTATVKRNESGRYIVALPFNEKREQLGESYSRALKRFRTLERKLERDPELRDQYTKVIDENRSLGHMTRVTNTHAPGFYLPHHAVIKPTSSTTKLRVVFDGSAKTSTNLSLNDTLRIGPTLQDDLLSLLLRFRMHAYVITGDIEKMYRQFLVQPEDRVYQRILWRDAHQEINTYELNTVTFGLAPAPYLAIRCLHQLADDEARDFPEAAARIKTDLYVDDLLTGTDSLAEAKKLQHQIITLLKRGGLNIRQWASNEPRLLSNLSKELIHPKILGDESTMKTLGVSWDARHDAIRYSVQPSATTEITKRTILSTIAKIYDPLGLLGPITIVAKILMQQLWTLKITWDESVPVNIHTEWMNFKGDIQQLNNIEFNRLVKLNNARQTEIHGFCDASERAYGACIYIRTIDKFGSIHAHLLCAKSRVAPLSQITLARLELCGAVLLATLFQTTRNALTYNIDKTTFWTDSTIVLGWLRKQPSILKTFVANRVADIQRKTDIQSWRYVRSADNPADLISRGITAAEFNNNALWRNGPEWLSKEQTEWPPARFTKCEELPELRSVTCLVSSTILTDEILMRYSCIHKLRRIVAYCLRFRVKDQNTGPLSLKEIKDSNKRIVKLLQAVTFAQDIHDLKVGKLSNTSKLQPLCPFLYDEGILFVGGRLQNSSLSFEQKHPILLPRGHHITRLIIRDSHQKNHHSGITATLYDVRQLYWPIDGKNTTRQIIRGCIKCFRMNPNPVDYVMGNLPAARVTEGRPFLTSGIDYCGPFFIKERQFRNRVRVNLVHVEVVSDLTTEAFIAALKRFIARRGMDEKFHHFITAKEISWHFMPALSPHFGGLWEAAVKSFKHHMKRVVGIELFTHEQFTTFVIEVEAILNSRPLTPLSSDPNDMSALTPGHFLIGGSLTCITETDFSQTPSNRLSTWQHIQKVKQDFWKRWHKEYVHQLNIRPKWTRGGHEINIGTVVLLKDDSLPPLCWHLGRIQQIHPGPDGIIRAVTVRTINGTYTRNVKRLAPLPNSNSAQSSSSAVST
ncbi:uncharacterized protein LOC143217670 [Lasioglossum baleicum]|uniref:uncharacterized protein LOC143217670 n=1 Tax=Lasioglossum baleicum TaxID=434251 RepID=UPI003FCCA3BF